MIHIANKLITMFRRDRPVHQVPQALRDLDRAMLLIVNEQQEAITLAKARETLLANPGQPSPTGSVSLSRPRPTVARKRSISPSVGVFAKSVAVAAIALFGLVALIVWAPRVIAIISLPSLIPLVIYLLIHLFPLRFLRFLGAIYGVSSWRNFRAPISRRADRPHRVAE